MKIEEMTREEKVALVVFNSLDNLVEMGILDTDGSHQHLTEKGKKILDELLDSGFEATQEEIRSFMDSAIEAGKMRFE